MRLIFEMLSNGNAIEAIALRFLDTDARPDLTIREHRVDVEIAGEAQKLRGIRELDGSATDMFVTVLGLYGQYHDQE